MEVGSAYVRIRPRVEETVRVLDVLANLGREIAAALERAADELRPLELAPGDPSDEAA